MGVSGGVDSSVVVYLLKKQGHEVHGVFVKTWSPEWLPCTWVDEKRDAMRVCAALDIPFHFLDAEATYRDGVAEYMLCEYRAGRTPNPDVLCNRVIKFGALWDYAKSQGAEAVATGHYARTDGVHLMKGVDTAKDQSYFLWMLTQAELAHIMLPIGHLNKSEVRAIAEQVGLFTGNKKDSQGICFLGNIDMREFLGHYIKQKKGEIIDTQGTVIGDHDGVWFHTLGERHGFRITTTDTDTRPYYIVGKNIEYNRLIVDHQPVAIFLNNNAQKVLLRDTNWIQVFDPTKQYTAQVRYHSILVDTKIVSENEVMLSHNGLVALGQSLVVYDGEVLVGGGIIDSVS